MTKDLDYKNLLKGAETYIVSLKKENEALRSDLESMIEAQALETEQMVQMSEQLWKLEEALMSETDEKETALMMLKSLKTSVTRIQTYAQETLSAVKEKNTSRVTMAAQVYEIKSMVETLELENKDK